MELGKYLITLRRRWFVPLTILALAILGVFTYNRYTRLETAQATVAVLDPFVAASGTYSQAQVPFDAIVKSHQLARRVAQRLGENPNAVAAHLSVTVLPPLSGLTVSPLYAVRGTARQADRALVLANTAVDEARTLYTELNSAEFTQADAELQQARDAFDKFAVNNHAAELPALIQKQLDVVASLQEAVYLARVDQEVTGGWLAARRTAALQHALIGAKDELDRLTALEPQYRDLGFKMQIAEAQVLALNKGQPGQVVRQLLVKTLDTAEIQSDLSGLVLKYALGVLLGLAAGLSAVYILALFGRHPETASDVAGAFRAPVLVRVPKAKA